MQDLEFGVIIHFGTNTFLDREWGDEPQTPRSSIPHWPTRNNGCALRRPPEPLRGAGGKAPRRLLPLADGANQVQCRRQPWMGGKGDLVRMTSDAAGKYGLRFGVYFSPWDRHDPRYKDPAAYDQYYLSELTE